MNTILSQVWGHGHGKSVRSGPMPARPAPPRGGVALAELARSGPHGEALLRILRLALAPRRWEPWNTFNDHRAYPSARAAFLVDVSLVVGHRRWLVDPVRDRLVGPASRLRLTGEPITLALSLHSERMPSGYGALAPVLAWLEAGHVAAALAEAAAPFGWLAATTLDGDGSPTLSLRPAGRGTLPLSRVAAPRSSGMGPRGLSADPRPLPADTLHALVQAAVVPPAGSPAGWAGLRHTIAVRGISGLAEGRYTVDGDGARLADAGPALDGVQWAFSYPREQVDVAGMNLGWIITADVAAASRAGTRDGGASSLGPYHRLLLAAGATAQHVGSAAATRGLFCRPARSVDEARIEAAAVAPANDDFLYLLLIGRSRVRDLAYQLFPPEVLP